MGGVGEGPLFKDGWGADARAERPYMGGWGQLRVVGAAEGGEAAWVGRWWGRWGGVGLVLEVDEGD